MRVFFHITILFVCSCCAKKNAVLLKIGQSFCAMGQWKAHDHSWLVPFERDEIEKKLKTKIGSKTPLVVHVLVPLCDNKHQGILPTTESLGDGFNLKTNLYWATRHGMKRYFVDHPKWNEKNISYPSSDTILERVVFERYFENGAQVLLICDAYRGDRMVECVSDYFHFLAGKKADSICVTDRYIQCGQVADMLVFNGHNGIYEAQVDPVYASKKDKRMLW